VSLRAALSFSVRHNSPKTSTFLGVAPRPRLRCRRLLSPTHVLRAAVESPDAEDDEDAAPDDDGTFVLEEADTPSLRPALAASARTAVSTVRAPTAELADVALVGVILAVVYGLASTTHRFFFSTTPYTSLVIDTSLAVLPSYALQSLTRMLAGYVVSLVFSLGYAYCAYRIPFAAQALMLAIDVLQSIPLLSFLPGVVLGLIALFPAGARVGVELAAVLLLFTSMAWNMLLGFYQSLCGIPRDLLDVAETFRLSPWRRFWVVELPAGAIGLIWNSIISVAGGWFFLISIESFELGNKDFRLPGLGSFLAAAAEAGNYSAILAGLGVIIAIVVVIDFLIWRPLIAWSAKFKYGGGTSADNSRSLVFNLLIRSPLIRALSDSILSPAWQAFVSLDFPILSWRSIPFRFFRSHAPRSTAGCPPSGVVSPAVSPLPYRMPPASQRHFVPVPARGHRLRAKAQATAIWRWVIAVLPWFVKLAFFAAVCVGTFRSVVVMRAIAKAQWLSLASAAVLTFARVFIALAISLMWAVPVGIAIGRNPALAARVQPIVQIAASVPATALFPFVLISLAKLGGGLEIGSIALMTLGTMWYVLFNVIAGAQAIPAELFEVDSVYNRGGGWVRRWRTLVLPGIFPYLITGIVTAVGGAWNASIVSEYVVFRGGVMKAHGLGALISEAAASGNYPLLLAGTVVMSVLVLLTNRFVWGPLYRLAETKYRI
jgi:NitT/TauT family transport system permease protein